VLTDSSGGAASGDPAPTVQDVPPLECQVGPPNCNIKICPGAPVGCQSLRDERDQDCDGVDDTPYGYTPTPDNCKTLCNPGQENADGDERGDLCDPCPLDTGDDQDVDGQCENVDNCDGVYNPDQRDADADGVGDACDLYNAGDIEEVIFDLSERVRELESRPR
jgi:hypothetical protein